uniref:Protein asunder n=1 Tax=Angiostrongylus cantonensis TaxID=6313 RepID=A0A0K0DJ77_ANGCA
MSTPDVLDSQDVREKTKLKRAANLRISDFISLIKECTLRIPNESEKQTSMTPSNILCAQPRQHLLRLTRYWPLRSDQCFIYNIPKRFDTLFTIIRQPQLSTVDADKCRQVIHQLTTLRDSKERLTETWVDTILLRDGTDRLLPVAEMDIAQVTHKTPNIFQLFAQLTGLERMAKVLTSDVVLTDRTRRLAKPCFIALGRTQLHEVSKTLNLYDYLMEKEERHHRTHWVDFVGRVKAGNRPAHLYPNLEATATTAKQD